LKQDLAKCLVLTHVVKRSITVIYAETIEIAIPLFSPKK